VLTALLYYNTASSAAIIHRTHYARVRFNNNIYIELQILSYTHKPRTNEKITILKLLSVRGRGQSAKPRARVSITALAYFVCTYNNAINVGTHSAYYAKVYFMRLGLYNMYIIVLFKCRCLVNKRVRFNQCQLKTLTVHVL